MEKKRSETEELFCFEGGVFFGRLVTYQAQGDLHILNIYRPALRAVGDGSFMFLKVESLADTDFQKLTDRLGAKGTWTRKHGWSDLPNTIIRDWFDRED